jgi:deoxyribodipyrimidine photo-lyase
MAIPKVSIFWFRRDLRIVDNCGLYNALQGKQPVLPVFIFDTGILGRLEDKTDKRVSFIYSEIQKLKQQIEAFGSTIKIYHSDPLSAFISITDAFEVGAVYTNEDYEPYAVVRDRIVSDYLKSKNIGFYSFKDQVLFNSTEVLKPDGSPYTVFTPYRKTWKKKLDETGIESFPSQKLVNRFIKIAPAEFPDIETLGFRFTGYRVKAPEIDLDLIKNYASTRDIPHLDATTKIGVHLRFGTVSIRELLKPAIQNSEIWLNELIWREFFMMILSNFPHVENSAFKAKYNHIEWMNNEKDFECWCRGETGYPLVDAGMRQLNETGFMHNRVRMVTASFLIKHLLVDWRWGEAYFASKLLDFDLAANNGNWQWAAGCGCDAAPYFRVFNPSEQLRKFDPEMKYCSKWLGSVEKNSVKTIVEHRFARERALNVFSKSVRGQS